MRMRKRRKTLIIDYCESGVPELHVSTLISSTMMKSRAITGPTGRPNLLWHYFIAFLDPLCLCSCVKRLWSFCAQFSYSRGKVQHGRSDKIWLVIDIYSSGNYVCKEKLKENSLMKQKKKNPFLCALVKLHVFLLNYRLQPKKVRNTSLQQCTM